jgi:curli production assembly/transport component CsgF
MKHKICQFAVANLVVIGLLCYPKLTLATGIIYAPNNPSFGGNPQNGPVLLNSANAQNHFTAPSSSGNTTTTSALDNFNQRLQSMILDRIATSVTGNLFDANGKLKSGVVDTTAFSIFIADMGGGILKITTTDKATGASTTFEINSAP